MKIASFNANSIRTRLPVILEWMQENDCDVVGVQETKVQDDNFPTGDIEDAGYHCVYLGQKSYNGVAIISRLPFEESGRGLGTDLHDREARVVWCTINGVRIINTYVPQGTEAGTERFQFKLDFIRGVRDWLESSFTPEDAVVWVGDLNVAREPIDVYDPEGLYGSVCYHPDEHEAFDYALSWGLVDVFRQFHDGEEDQFTFYDYRVPNAAKRRMGWRIDHILATKPLVDKATGAFIDKGPRLKEKPSDHTFIAADFDV